MSSPEISEIKKNYKELLEKYKHRQDSNEFLKLQLQDMSAKLKQEQKDKDKLRDEVSRTREEMLGGHSPNAAVSSDDGRTVDPPTAAAPLDWELVVDKLQSRLKDAYSKLDEETKLHEETKNKLEYTKQMLLAEGRTRVFLEERNSVLELKIKQTIAQGLSDMEAMCNKLQDANKMLEEEVSTRLILQQDKEGLEAEIEDLTKSLFEEANSMVSVEARQRHELACAKKKLEEELEDTKNRLAIDRAVLHSLQERFTYIEKEKKSNAHHRQSHSTTSVAILAASLRGVNSQPNLSLMETKGAALPVLSVSPPAASPPTGSPLSLRSSKEEDPLKWRKRSKSLGDDALANLGVIVIDQAPQAQLQQVIVSDGVNTRSTEEHSDGSDWEILEGTSSEEDDNTIDIGVQGRINSKAGLQQFVVFVTSPKQEWSGTRLMDRVLREDVGPCLRLRMQEDKAYRKLLEAVWNNKIFLEPLTAQQSEQATQCSACDGKETCRWRVRYSVDMEWKVIDDLCRERIIRACDFYSYLRNIRKGLVKKNLVAMYKEYVRLRLMMNFARVCAG